MRNALLLVLSLLAFNAPAIELNNETDKTALTLQTGSEKLVFTLKDLKKKLSSKTVTVSDPVYKTQKTYDAFSLADIFKLGKFGEGNEIVFESSDGYAPSFPLSSILKQTDANSPMPYLAYQEHARKDGKLWATFEQGKAPMTPAPYYLVWTHLEGNKVEGKGNKALEEHPWPYQLIRIELVNFKETYKKIYPVTAKGDSPQMKGFTIFKNECIRCHSVNLVGGSVGPELNTPKNVTEYWDVKTLRQFIQNPGLFRAKDKMPPFPKLTSEDLDDLFTYFEFLKNTR
jgi:mono/diheme cytochrome c family protein